MTRRSVTPVTVPSYQPAPWQQLAAAVIWQALKDARNPYLHERQRISARAFLSGSFGLPFWAAVLGVRVEALTDYADRVLHQDGRPARL